MAGNGMNIIDAINEIVETVGEFPMADNADSNAPSGSGTSIYHRARKFLDRESKRVQSQGWPENTANGQARVADSSGHVDMTTGTGSNGTYLSIRGAGPDAHRDLSLRVDTTDSNKLKVYDNNKGTFAVTTNAGTIFIDEVEAIGASTASWGFSNLSPQLQDVVVDAAKVRFQRRIQGNLDMDTALQHERMASDHVAPRNQPLTENRLNITPITSQKSRPQKEG